MEQLCVYRCGALHTIQQNSYRQRIREHANSITFLNMHGFVQLGFAVILVGLLVLYSSTLQTKGT